MKRRQIKRTILSKNLPGISVLKLLLTPLFAFALSSQLSAQEDIPFTAEQAVNGKAIYQQHCLICHGTRLSNGQFGTPLKGSYFKNKWAGQTVGDLVLFAYENMPPDNKKLLEVGEYAEVIAFILESNRLEAGSTPIPDNFAALNQIMLPW